MFVDKAEIHIKSGKGGDGAVSFRREPFVPEGGPDGGDGGKGGDIVFVCDQNMRTLMDFRYKTKYQAQDGENGKKKKCFGKNGEDLIIKIPAGTIIIDKQTGKVMADMLVHEQRFVAAKGGKGGRGNTNFKSSTRRAPDFATLGSLAEEKSVILEMKLIADVGLVGFPNVGKSTLLSVTTASKPKIANYHFTTIAPNLGVVQSNNFQFLMADIAGIIKGAHSGLGLGHEFLKHIERTRILIHVVDVSGIEGRDPIEDFELINEELRLYDPVLAEKPQLVAANKTDLLFDDESKKRFEKFIDVVESKGYRVFPISAATKEGVSELITEVTRMLNSLPPENPIYDFYEFDDNERKEEIVSINASYSKDEDVFVLDGIQLKRIVDATDFNDMSALRYLQKYLEKKGAIDSLKSMGLKDGDSIRIADFEFEYFDE